MATTRRSLNPRASASVKRYQPAAVNQAVAASTWTGVIVPTTIALWYGPGNTPTVASIGISTQSIVTGTTDGFYHVTGQLQSQTTTTGRRALGFEFSSSLDGAAGSVANRSELPFATGGTFVGQISYVGEIPANTYVRMTFWQNSTTTPFSIVNSAVGNNGLQASISVIRVDEFNYPPVP